MSNVKEQVNELNQMILEGNILEAFDKFYDESVKMQENDQPATEGKSACRKNEEAFVSSITEFRGAEVKNVIAGDNISVVEWHFDYDHKDWGTRKYDQVAVQNWKDGKIINERFFYSN
ncbi:nuclear transport factor 2 family protein [Flexithrix dorotheae]|uniref:nuclear transport factor 2 family protein n=1 Tax=Flexithrix dorotheae TaxID=70993 RepID=UPI00039CD99C|nr:nuclear transport factor 2 family protein [Flexithrix dorotheae]